MTVRRVAFALVLLAAGPALAAGDCPGVGPPAGYTAEHDPDGRAYDSMVFPVGPEPGAAMETITGVTCLQHYAAPDGSDDTRALLAIRLGLAFSGAAILGSETPTVFARATVAGETVWIRVTGTGGGIDVATIRRRPRAQVLTPPDASDDPRIGHMPGYGAETTDRRAYDQRGFSVRAGDDISEVVVQGARTEIDYVLRDGARPASDLDIQENYRQALRDAGASILFTDDHDTVARFDGGKNPVWMKVWSQDTAINLTVVEAGPHVPSLLPPAGLDHRLLGHMPGYVADPPERQALDEVTFTIQDGEDTKDVKIQGARFDVTYNLRAGATPASDLDIQLNYRAALARLGAQVLFSSADTIVARLVDGERLMWIKVWSQENAITVSFVKETAFKSTVRATPAETLKTALDDRGRAALHVAFDFNRASLRPQAGAILGEVIRLLHDNPSMVLSVEDHTDDIGPRAENIALALARAKEVCGVLVAGGIAPARLRPVGVGPDRPVTDNDTSEGRARNRRIVLVRQ